MLSTIPLNTRPPNTRPFCARPCQSANQRASHVDKASNFPFNQGSSQPANQARISSDKEAGKQASNDHGYQQGDRTDDQPATCQQGMGTQQPPPQPDERARLERSVCQGGASWALGCRSAAHEIVVICSDLACISHNSPSDSEVVDAGSLPRRMVLVVTGFSLLTRCVDSLDPTTAHPVQPHAPTAVLLPAHLQLVVQTPTGPDSTTTATVRLPYLQLQLSLSALHCVLQVLDAYRSTTTGKSPASTAAQTTQVAVQYSYVAVDVLQKKTVLDASKNENAVDASQKRMAVGVQVEKLRVALLRDVAEQVGAGKEGSKSGGGLRFGTVDELLLVSGSQLLLGAQDWGPGMRSGKAVINNLDVSVVERASLASYTLLQLCGVRVAVSHSALPPEIRTVPAAEAKAWPHETEAAAGGAEHGGDAILGAPDSVEDLLATLQCPTAPGLQASVQMLDTPVRVHVSDIGVEALAQAYSYVKAALPLATQILKPTLATHSLNSTGAGYNALQYSKESPIAVRNMCPVPLAVRQEGRENFAVVPAGKKASLFWALGPGVDADAVRRIQVACVSRAGGTSQPCGWSEVVEVSKLSVHQLALSWPGGLFTRIALNICRTPSQRYLITVRPGFLISNHTHLPLTLCFTGLTPTTLTGSIDRDMCQLRSSGTHLDGTSCPSATHNDLERHDASTAYTSGKGYSNATGRKDGVSSHFHVANPAEFASRPTELTRPAMGQNTTAPHAPSLLLPDLSASYQKTDDGMPAPAAHLFYLGPRCSRAEVVDAGVCSNHDESADVAVMVLVQCDMVGGVGHCSLRVLMHGGAWSTPLALMTGKPVAGTLTRGPPVPLSILTPSRANPHDPATLNMSTSTYTTQTGRSAGVAAHVCYSFGIPDETTGQTVLGFWPQYRLRNLLPVPVVFGVQELPMDSPRSPESRTASNAPQVGQLTAGSGACLATPASNISLLHLHAQPPLTDWHDFEAGPRHPLHAAGTQLPTSTSHAFLTPLARPPPLHASIPHSQTSDYPNSLATAPMPDSAANPSVQAAAHCSPSLVGNAPSCAGNHAQSSGRNSNTPTQLPHRESDARFPSSHPTASTQPPHANSNLAHPAQPLTHTHTTTHAKTHHASEHDPQTAPTKARSSTPGPDTPPSPLTPSPSFNPSTNPSPTPRAHANSGSHTGRCVPSLLSKRQCVPVFTQSSTHPLPHSNQSAAGPWILSRVSSSVAKAMHLKPVPKVGGRVDMVLETRPALAVGLQPVTGEEGQGGPGADACGTEAGQSSDTDARHSEGLDSARAHNRPEPRAQDSEPACSPANAPCIAAPGQETGQPAGTETQSLGPLNSGPATTVAADTSARSFPNGRNVHDERNGMDGRKLPNGSNTQGGKGTPDARNSWDGRNTQDGSAQDRWLNSDARMTPDRSASLQSRTISETSEAASEDSGVLVDLNDRLAASCGHLQVSALGIPVLGGSAALDLVLVPNGLLVNGTSMPLQVSLLEPAAVSGAGVAQANSTSCLNMPPYNPSRTYKAVLKALLPLPSSSPDHPEYLELKSAEVLLNPGHTTLTSLLSTHRTNSLSHNGVWAGAACVAVSVDLTTWSQPPTTPIPSTHNAQPPGPNPTHKILRVTILPPLHIINLSSNPIQLSLEGLMGGAHSGSFCSSGATECRPNVVTPVKMANVELLMRATGDTSPGQSPGTVGVAGKVPLQQPVPPENASTGSLVLKLRMSHSDVAQTHIAGASSNPASSLPSCLPQHDQATPASGMLPGLHASRADSTRPELPSQNTTAHPVSVPPTAFSSTLPAAATTSTSIYANGLDPSSQYTTARFATTPQIASNTLHHTIAATSPPTHLPPCSNATPTSSSCTPAPFRACQCGTVQLDLPGQTRGRLCSAGACASGAVQPSTEVAGSVMYRLTSVDGHHTLLLWRDSQPSLVLHNMLDVGLEVGHCLASRTATATGPGVQVRKSFHIPPSASIPVFADELFVPPGTGAASGGETDEADEGALLVERLSGQAPCNGLDPSILRVRLRGSEEWLAPFECEPGLHRFGALASQITLVGPTSHVTIIHNAHRSRSSPNFHTVAPLPTPFNPMPLPIRLQLTIRSVQVSMWENQGDNSAVPDKPWTPTASPISSCPSRELFCLTLDNISISCNTLCKPSPSIYPLQPTSSHSPSSGPSHRTETEPRDVREQSSRYLKSTHVRMGIQRLQCDSYLSDTDGYVVVTSEHEHSRNSGLSVRLRGSKTATGGVADGSRGMVGLVVNLEWCKLIGQTGSVEPEGTRSGGVGDDDMRLRRGQAVEGSSSPGARKDAGGQGHRQSRSWDGMRGVASCGRGQGPDWGDTMSGDKTGARLCAASAADSSAGAGCVAAGGHVSYNTGGIDASCAARADGIHTVCSDVSCAVDSDVDDSIKADGGCIAGNKRSCIVAAGAGRTADVHVGVGGGATRRSSVSNRVSVAQVVISEWLEDVQVQVPVLVVAVDDAVLLFLTHTLERYMEMSKEATVTATREGSTEQGAGTDAGIAMDLGGFSWDAASHPELCHPSAVRHTQIMSGLLSTAQVLSGPRIFLSRASCSSIRLLLDLHLAEGGGVLPIALDTNRAPFGLSQVRLEHIRVPWAVLKQALSAHYMAEGLMNAPQVLGSFELLFNLTGLVGSITQGAWDLVALPLAGLEERSAAAFIAGLGRGSASLPFHLSKWALTSISGFSSAFSKLLRTSMTQRHPNIQPPTTAVTTAYRPPREAPLTFSGIASSVGRGMLGMIGYPLSGALDVVSAVSGGLATTSGFTSVLKSLRAALAPGTAPNAISLGRLQHILNTIPQLHSSCILGCCTAEVSLAHVHPHDLHHVVNPGTRHPSEAPQYASSIGTGVPVPGNTFVIPSSTRRPSPAPSDFHSASAAPAPAPALNIPTGAPPPTRPPITAPSGSPVCSTVSPTSTLSGALGQPVRRDPHERIATLMTPTIQAPSEPIPCAADTANLQPGMFRADRILVIVTDQFVVLTNATRQNPWAVLPVVGLSIVPLLGGAVMRLSHPAAWMVAEPDRVAHDSWVLVSDDAAGQAQAGNNRADVNRQSHLNHSGAVELGQLTCGDLSVRFDCKACSVAGRTCNNQDGQSSGPAHHVQHGSRVLAGAHGGNNWVHADGMDGEWIQSDWRDAHDPRSHQPGHISENHIAGADKVLLGGSTSSNSWARPGSRQNNNSHPGCGVREGNRHPDCNAREEVQLSMASLVRGVGGMQRACWTQDGGESCNSSVMVDEGDSREPGTRGRVSDERGAASTVGREVERKGGQQGANEAVCGDKHENGGYVAGSYQLPAGYVMVATEMVIKAVGPRAVDLTSLLDLCDALRP